MELQSRILDCSDEVPDEGRQRVIVGRRIVVQRQFEELIIEIAEP